MQSSGKKVGFGTSQMSFHILAQLLIKHMTYEAYLILSFLTCKMGCDVQGACKD